MRPPKHFGPHLFLEFPTESDKLNNKPHWKALLKNLVEIIDTRPLCEPVVVFSECENEAWKHSPATGLSGFIVLAESHVAFHTFVEAKYVFMDVFSCKSIDQIAVGKFLKERLGAYQVHQKLHRRGFNFPLA